MPCRDQGRVFKPNSCYFNFYNVRELDLLSERDLKPIDVTIFNGQGLIIHRLDAKKDHGRNVTELKANNKLVVDTALQIAKWGILHNRSGCNLALLVRAGIAISFIYRQCNIFSGK